MILDPLDPDRNLEHENFESIPGNPCKFSPYNFSLQTDINSYFEKMNKQINENGKYSKISP